MLNQVFAGEGLRRGVVFVVGRLYGRQQRKVAFLHRTKEDVVAAKPKAEQGAMLD